MSDMCLNTFLVHIISIFNDICNDFQENKMTCFVNKKRCSEIDVESDLRGSVFLRATMFDRRGKVVCTSRGIMSSVEGSSFSYVNDSFPRKRFFSYVWFLRLSVEL